MDYKHLEMFSIKICLFKFQKFISAECILIKMSYILSSNKLIKLTLADWLISENLMHFTYPTDYNVSVDKPTQVINGWRLLVSRRPELKIQVHRMKF